MSEPSAPAPSTGTPDAPDFKPRRGLFLLLLVIYAGFIAALIAWAMQLRR